VVVVGKLGSAPHLAPQDDQLMSEHRILRLKPALRLERRGHNGQNKADQRNHRANLCWLVVYLNISEYGIRQLETEQVIAAAKARYAAAFVDVSVLWKGKLY
jgi:hypothetical protein